MSATEPSLSFQSTLDKESDRPPPDVVRELGEPLPKLHLADLRRGDVLLSRGKGQLSDLIALMDNGRYSHAAIFDGAKFVQATTKGVVASAPLVMQEHQWYLDVHRFHTQDGKELDSGGPASQPILDVVHAFIGDDYAYDELAMCAIIFVLRKSTALPYVGKLLEIMGGISLSALRTFIREHVLKRKKQAMICSEVVARGYWQASDSKGDPYGLRLDIKHRHGELMAANFTEAQFNRYDEVAAEIERAFDELDPQIAAEWDVVRAPPLQSNGVGMTPIAGSKLFPAGCVSPRDLQDSFSLRRVGRYDDWDQ